MSHARNYQIGQMFYVRFILTSNSSKTDMTRGSFGAPTRGISVRRAIKY